MRGGAKRQEAHAGSESRSTSYDKHRNSRSNIACRKERYCRGSDGQVAEELLQPTRCAPVEHA